MSRPTLDAPVRRTVIVPAPQARAFALFTDHHDTWWPREYHIGEAPMAEAVLEPREGGRWYERGTDGRDCTWGRVLVWEPPERLVLAWQIDGQWRYDPSLVTEVEVRFVPEGPERTRVELEHRHLERFGEHREAVRAAFESPQGWGGMLERLARSASATAGHS